MSASDRLERDAALLSPTLTEEEIARMVRRNLRRHHHEVDRRRKSSERKVLVNAEQSDRVSR
ncbi:MAG: hypothetical protein IT350_08095 [Deltaproteobacteria bacterium]|nr:hypothetical protein [Deltaproteobacteria bacterium]